MRGRVGVLSRAKVWLKYENVIVPAAVPFEITSYIQIYIYMIK